MDSKEPVWRISQADIVHNTAFSSFPYYNRSLVLIDGAGLGLTHVDQPPHTLKKPLDTAHFSGKYETLPTLLDGSVRVLNIMGSGQRLPGEANNRLDPDNRTRRLHLPRAVCCERRTITG